MKTIKYLLILGFVSCLHNIHAGEMYEIDQSVITYQNYPTLYNYLAKKLISMFNAANAQQKEEFIQQFKINPDDKDLEALDKEISLLKGAIAIQKENEFKKSLEEAGL